MAKQSHVWEAASFLQWRSSGCAGYLGSLSGPIEACGAGRDPRERPRAVGRSEHDFTRISYLERICSQIYHCYVPWYAVLCNM